jgi:hypothetical protein
METGFSFKLVTVNDSGTDILWGAWSTNVQRATCWYTHALTWEKQNKTNQKDVG